MSEFNWNTFTDGDQDNELMAIFEKLSPFERLVLQNILKHIGSRAFHDGYADALEPSE